LKGRGVGGGGSDVGWWGPIWKVEGGVLYGGCGSCTVMYIHTAPSLRRCCIALLLLLLLVVVVSHGCFLSFCRSNWTGVGWAGRTGWTKELIHKWAARCCCCCCCCCCCGFDKDPFTHSSITPYHTIPRRHKCHVTYYYITCPASLRFTDGCGGYTGKQQTGETWGVCNNSTYLMLQRCM
jgi:hypothetical protein